MSRKTLDAKGRWRNKFCGIRLSQDEYLELKTLVHLSGMTSQDYIINKLLNHEIVVTGNPRVFLALKREIEAMIHELEALKTGGELSDEQLDRIAYIVEMYQATIDCGTNRIHESKEEKENRK